MKKRIISAIVALLIIIPLLIIGGPLFYIGVGVVGIIGFYELLCVRDTYKKIPNLIKIISVIFFIFILLGSTFSNEIFNIDFKIILLMMLILLIPTIFYDKKNYVIDDAFFIISSLLLLGITFNLLIVLRNISLSNIIYIALITVMSDTFAHFWGSQLGRHKLCPKVSPNKTIEGLVGGTIMGTTISVLYYTAVFEYNSLVLVIIMSLTLSLIGQIGDLIFSAIKRKYEVKDFGNIMPGHGGILDRLDSILIATMAYSIILMCL